MTPYGDARKRLMNELQELVRRYRGLQDHLRNRGGRSPEQLEDWMNVIEQDEVVESLDLWALERMQQVLAALDRIDRGTYGRSVKSGLPIEPERLRAIPWASLTAQEASEQEDANIPPVERTASLDKARPVEGEEIPALTGGSGTNEEG